MGEKILNRTPEGELYFGSPIDPEKGLHGSGLRQERDGGLYIGEWSEGLREGFGASFDRDGYVCIGTWAGDRPAERCVLIYPADGPYVAFFGGLHEKNFNEGIAFFANGRLYYGSFTNWRGANFDGVGALRFPDGRIYAGPWKNGNTSAGGVMRRADGNEALKQIKDHTAKAWGADADRIFFYGKTQDEEIRNAEGTSFYADGSLFDGTLRGGIRHGPGVCRNADGGILAGVWKNGVQQGAGIRLRRTGDEGELYIGGFAEGLPHGSGVSLAYKGRKWTLVYCGGWVKGQWNGTGLNMLEDGRLFLGRFLEGQRDGAGVIIGTDGTRTAWKPAPSAPPEAVPAKAAPTKETPAKAAAVKAEQAAPDVKKTEQVKTPRELHHLGVDYYAGRNGLEKDVRKAAECFRKAAEAGYARAQSWIGCCCEYGYGVDQDLAQAAVWYQKAAEQNDAFAQYHLAQFYEKGTGVEQDLEAALKNYRAAAENGKEEAQKAIKRLEKAKQAAPQTAAAPAETAAVKGPEAGGVRWSNLNAVLDEIQPAPSAEEQYQLGLKYECGEGGHKDEKKAVELYGLAAKRGNVSAQYRLGKCFYSGIGVEQDQAAALRWFEKAAEQGHADAQYVLGQCCFTGTIVKEDRAKALEWFQKAADQNYPAAQGWVSYFYESGIIVQRSMPLALEWCQKAAGQGDRSAQCRLGMFYYNGTGVERDRKTAVQWFRKSADQGYAAAQAMLGRCFQYGEGVEKDLSKAWDHYRIAAENGNQDAQKALDEMERERRSVLQADTAPIGARVRPDAAKVRTAVLKAKQSLRYDQLVLTRDFPEALQNAINSYAAGADAAAAIAVDETARAGLVRRRSEGILFAETAVYSSHFPADGCIQYNAINSVNLYQDSVRITLKQGATVVADFGAQNANIVSILRAVLETL